MKKQSAWVTRAFVVLGFFVATADAASVLTELFTYPDGDLSGQGNWAQTSASLVNPIQVSGGKAVVQNTGQDVYKAFSSSVPRTNGTSMYTSLDLTITSAQSAGDFFFNVSDPAGTTTGFYQRVFARSSGAGYQLGLVDTSGTNSTITYGLGVLSLNQLYHIVIGWNFVAGTVNDTFAMYVDPTNPVQGLNTAYLTHSWTSVNGEPTQLSAANLRQGLNTAAPNATIDNIEVATTFPEPTSLSLLGLAGLMALRRRR